MLVTAFITVLTVVYLGLLHRAASDGAGAARHRTQLLSRAAEATLMVAIARIAIPYTAVTGWLWVVSVALLAAGIARAALRARGLAADEPAEPRWRSAGRATYAIAMLVLTAIVLIPLA